MVFEDVLLILLYETLTSVFLLLPGAQFVADESFKHEFDTGWNNAMHEYYTTTSE